MIDLRAPVEFAADRLPGAHNIPLFENETRSFVGLLYKQFSPEAAFQAGSAAVAGRIEDLVREVAEVGGWRAPEGEDLVARVHSMTATGMAGMERELVSRRLEALPEDAIVLSCARGGLRSRSVVALLRALGCDRAVGLEDGYRGLRRQVMESLEAWRPPARVISLRGLTGVGKTLVLRAIEARRPGWTLDLEGLAGHRSSLLGMVGLEPVTQKAFETAMSLRLAEGFPGDVMIVEGESRKVGDAVIPGTVWEAMGVAVNVHVTASLDRRVEVLASDYLADAAARPKLREQLDAVSARMEGRPDLAGMLDRGEVGPLVSLLLGRYYDPLYLKSEEGKRYSVEVAAESAEAAADEIVSWVEGDAGRACR